LHVRYAFTGWFSVAEHEPNATGALVQNFLQNVSSLSPTFLCELMTKNKSDKGTGRHNYTLLYDILLKGRKEEELRVFELGLGTNNVSIPSNMGADANPGSSLYGWEEYFPKSHIFGADIDKGILFNSGRIMTFYCDQMDPLCISSMWAHPELSLPFDLIVEDGYHTFVANKCFLENSLHKLKTNGFYIIEDILSSEISFFETQILQWEKKYEDCTFHLVKIPHFRNMYDNNLLLVHKKK